MTDQPEENAAPTENNGSEEQPPAEMSAASKPVSAPSEAQAHTGKGGQNLWFVPDDSLTDEQLEQIQTAEQVGLSDEPIPDVMPSQPGEWYTPPNAITLGDLGSVLDTAFVGSIQPAANAVPDVLDLEEDADVAAEEVETAQEKPEPEAPVAFGEGDFKSAPEGPVDSPDELGLGGLRDEKRGLSPDEVARQEQVGPEVPARGFGGVRGGEDAQATRTLSDTGAVGAQTPPPSSTQDFQAAPAPPAQPDPKVEEFRAVERSVTQLREQFARGQISRPQLEAELRKLIIMDDQGRWWTIGVDSNRWYRYDGREWIPDTPPQTDAMAPVSSEAGPRVQGSFVPTETSVQAPVKPGPSQDTPIIELDDYGMPLPQKVPLEDPQATMVNLNVATGSSEEATWDVTQPSQPQPQRRDVIPDPAAQTISSAEAVDAVYGEETIARDAYDDQRGYYDEDQDEKDAEAQPKQKGLQPDYSAAYNRQMDRSTVVRYGVWAGIGGVVVSLAVVLCMLLGMVAYYFSVVNDFSDRIDQFGQRASSFQSTRIYDAGGNVLAQYNDPNTGARTEVPLEDISPWLIHATIATEDESFYDNPGFSVFAIVRAVYTNVVGEGPRSGASTITQQLVRALLLDEDFAAELSAERKVTEIILAAEINRRYDKNQILEFYLNEIYYGNLAYGVEAAAQVYFDKSASELNVFESAFLAGLPQAPAIYDPVRNRTVALDRMQTVLRLMTEANDDGCILIEDLNTNVEGFDLSQPLCISEAMINGPELAVDKALIETRLFEPPSFSPRYGHFVNWIWSQLEENYDVNDIYDTGFNVYTTLQPNVQNAAQQAITDQLAAATQRGFRINNGSAVVMDPRNGAVIAMVGSADFNNEAIDGQVNVALTPQQPGSSIKPLVYLTALEGTEEGYWTPATIIWDTDSCWGNPPAAYCPTNFDGEFRGPVSVRRALANSLNVPAVKTMEFVTPSRFETRAQELGLSFPLQAPSEAGLPAALGAAEVRLLDLVATYSVFANQGQRFAPYGIERIETSDGDIIFQHTPEVEGLNVRPEHAYLINNILSDDNARAEEFGRGTVLTIPGREVAAKTGTTNENRDMLTVGWTPQVITGVWMGNTNNDPSGGATGFSVAAPVWNLIMQTALIDQPAQAFTRPQGIIGDEVCVDTGAKVPPGGCGVGGSRNEIFFASQPPPPPENGVIENVLIDPWTGLRANEFCDDAAVSQSFLVTDDGTALNWLRNNPNGQAWAAARGIDVSGQLATPPAAACTPGQERPEINVASPADNQVFNVGDLVTIQGAATAPNFEFYRLEIASGFTPNEFTAIGEFTTPRTGPSAALGQWNTAGFEPGPYVLRLTVRATTGAEASDQVSITLQ